MAKFRIYASYTVNLFLDIEADTFDEALDVARVADGADFVPIDESGWNIDEVREIK